MPAVAGAAAIEPGGTGRDAYPASGATTHGPGGGQPGGPTASVGRGDLGAGGNAGRGNDRGRVPVTP